MQHCLMEAAHGVNAVLAAGVSIIRSSVFSFDLGRLYLKLENLSFPQEQNLFRI